MVTSALGERIQFFAEVISMICLFDGSSKYRAVCCEQRIIIVVFLLRPKEEVRALEQRRAFNASKLGDGSTGVVFENQRNRIRVEGVEKELYFEVRDVIRHLEIGLCGEQIGIGIVPAIQYVKRFIETILERCFVTAQHEIRRMWAKEVFVSLSHVREEPFTIYRVEFETVENVVQDEISEFVGGFRYDIHTNQYGNME